MCLKKFEQLIHILDIFKLVNCNALPKNIDVSQVDTLQHFLDVLNINLVKVSSHNEFEFEYDIDYDASVCETGRCKFGRVNDVS